MEIEIGVIIAERRLEVVETDGTRSPARILLGAPRNFPDSSAFWAPYRIEYCRRERSMRSAGVDGFQALQLAMKMIHVEIEVIEKKQGIKFRWEGANSGNVGFDD
jgi:hypothetical protein